jgi:ubiquinone/menaquinone biosynthesis C-methylase UbiE
MRRCAVRPDRREVLWWLCLPVIPLGGLDPIRGEIVKAFVVLGPGREASSKLVSKLQHTCAGRPRPTSTPHAIEFVAALPKTITGKIRRGDLKQVEISRQGAAMGMRPPGQGASSMQADPPTPATVHDTIQRHWTGRAARYDDDPDHALHSEAQRQAWLALLQRWTGAEPLDVLDVGCGTAFLALQLAGLGHRAVGVDGVEAMLNVARAKASQAGLTIDFRLADAAALPFAPASFDLVVERHVLWTMPNPTAALADWVRVLRPGGRLILIEVHGRGSRHADYETIRSALPLVSGRPATEITPLVEAAGLADPVVEPLTDEVLWGGPGENPRYALSAQKPS